MNQDSYSYDIGDLVLASKSGDMNWNEPWVIGRISAFGYYPDAIRINESPDRWKHYVKIFKDTADLVAAEYRNRKGTVFIPTVAESILTGSFAIDRTIASTENTIDIDGMTIAQRLELIQQLQKANERENRRIFEGRAAIVSSWFNSVEEARNFCQGYSDWVKPK